MSEEIKVRLINEDYLRERFPIPAGVDTQNILRSVRIAQSIYLIDILGSCLYEAMETKIIDGEITDAGNEDFLSLLILSKEYLVYKTVKMINETIIAGDAIVGDESSERNGIALTTNGMTGEYENRIRNLVKGSGSLWAIANPDACKGYNQFEVDETGVVTFYPQSNNNNSCL